MSEGTAALPPDDHPTHAAVTYKLRPAHGNDLALLTQLVLGARPVILIHVGLDEDNESLAFDIDATGPDDVEELAKTFDLIAHVLRAGVPVEGGVSDD